MYTRTCTPSHCHTHTHTHTHMYTYSLNNDNIYAFTHTLIHAAALSLSQGRITFSTPVDVEIVPVVGIATVELGGDPASQPTYFFDCVTTRNNGSGIRWERLSASNSFDVGDIPDGSAGKRLNARRIDYPDLDIYICSDRFSDDNISVNITACK